MANTDPKLYVISNTSGSVLQLNEPVGTLEPDEQVTVFRSVYQLEADPTLAAAMAAGQITVVEHMDVDLQRLVVEATNQAEQDTAFARGAKFVIRMDWLNPAPTTTTTTTTTLAPVAVTPFSYTFNHAGGIDTNSFYTYRAIEDASGLHLDQQTDPDPFIETALVYKTPWGGNSSPTYRMRFNIGTMGNMHVFPFQLLQAPAFDTYGATRVPRLGTNEPQTLRMLIPANTLDGYVQGVNAAGDAVNLGGPFALATGVDYDAFIVLSPTTARMYVQRVSDSYIVLDTAVRTFGVDLWTLQTGNQWWLSAFYDSYPAGTGRLTELDFQVSQTV